MPVSDEENVLLEDDVGSYKHEYRSHVTKEYLSECWDLFWQSMDEMHELETDLMASMDTNASPVKPSIPSANRRHEIVDEDDGKHSDESRGSSSDESDGGSAENKPTRRRIPRTQTTGLPDEHGQTDEGEDDDPPEIPGSPLRSTMSSDGNGKMHELSTINGSDTAPARQKQNAPTADILTIEHEDDEDGEDDYETKEAEAPRAMEFHTSSSSSDSEREATDSEEEEDKHHRLPAKQAQHVRHERPKTAAKELALYRDVMPTEYFEQIVQDAPSSPKKQAQSAVATNPSSQTQKQERIGEKESRVSAKASPAQSSAYKVRVPREIEDLFQYVGEFTPDVIDIPTRLQPFIPEYVPAVGLPFDGIQIPRPDGKPDAAGVAFVREPYAQSNTAELELLLRARAKNKRRLQQANSLERVHSIEDAAYRPREIDHWIASVAKIQALRPQPQVLYKKPMPSETTLMELWPEEFEAFLSTQSLLPVSKMDLDLPETIRVVCGILDIPVHEGLYIHSLHALFSLYHEALLYEKEMLDKTSGTR